MGQLDRLKVPIHFRPMLNAVEPNELLAVMNPIEDTIIAHAQFAEAA
jgi:hypothetical protein